MNQVQIRRVRQVIKSRAAIEAYSKVSDAWNPCSSPDVRGLPAPCRSRSRHGERADGGFELDSVELCASRGPVLRREFQVVLFRPVRQHAHHLVEVLLGLDAVQAA